MNRTSIARRLAVTAGLAAAACLAAAGLAGCASHPPVHSLPVDPASPTPSSTPSTTPTTARPTPSHSPTHYPTACLGRVTYTVDGSDQLAGGNLCMRVGGIVRITNAFPPAEPSPASHADCVYEAGITDCRLLRTGTVTLTFGGEGSDKRSIIVVVTK